MYVVENTNPPLATKTIDGTVYANAEMVPVANEEPPEYRVEPLKITTLNGFIDYIRTNRDGLIMAQTLVQVTGPASVRLISTPDGEKLYRDVFIESNAELPRISFDQFKSHEDFMIMLQSSFVQNEHRDQLLKYVGHIKVDESVDITDDGISQKIIAKTGVAAVGEVILPNPVLLKPYRTFQELEQPETEFVLRVENGGRVALFEADGGAWKVECRKRIKTALAEALGDVEGVCFIS